MSQNSTLSKSKMTTSASMHCSQTMLDAEIIRRLPCRDMHRAICEPPSSAIYSTYIWNFTAIVHCNTRQCNERFQNALCQAVMQHTQMHKRALYKIVSWHALRCRHMCASVAIYSTFSSPQAGSAGPKEVLHCCVLLASLHFPLMHHRGDFVLKTNWNF